MFPVGVERICRFTCVGPATFWDRRDMNTKQVSDRDFWMSFRVAVVSLGRFGIDVSLFFGQ